MVEKVKIKWFGHFYHAVIFKIPNNCNKYSYNLIYMMPSPLLFENLSSMESSYYFVK